MPAPGNASLKGRSCAASTDYHELQSDFPSFDAQRMGQPHNKNKGNIVILKMFTSFN